MRRDDKKDILLVSVLVFHGAALVVGGVTHHIVRAMLAIVLATLLGYGLAMLLSDRSGSERLK